MPELAALTWVLVFGVIFFGGFIKGVVGFGYAIASTAILATVIDPSIAVVVMILPMLAANVSLLRELDRSEIRSCLNRFWIYVVAALIGTVVGMFLLDVIPKPVLALLIGGFTLLYVLTKQPWLPVPGESWIAERCFTTGWVAKGSLGFVSGIVFGAANIAVQVVAYLDSLSLDRSTFVGVLAMILVGISSLRVGMAWTLGLYGSNTLLLYSAIGTVPGVLGVSVGGRFRQYIPAEYQLIGVLGLLIIIGLRLTTAGLAGL
ncbi:MAG: sulfite exporter TauE/SafE family protein [Halobacteriales archaeon]|nr:sulfite exporter TauE/SafE family protein [Halobacteriales archaeon]